MRVIYLRTTDQQTVNALELIYFDSNSINDENRFEVFSFFQLSAIALKKSRQTSDCFAKCLHALLTSFKRQNDATPSNAMTDVIFAVVTDVS